MNVRRTNVMSTASILDFTEMLLNRLGICGVHLLFPFSQLLKRIIKKKKKKKRFQP